MGRNGVAESPRPVPDGSEPTEAPAAEPPSPALPASSYRRFTRLPLLSQPPLLRQAWPFSLQQMFVFWGCSSFPATPPSYHCLNFPLGKLPVA